MYTFCAKINKIEANITNFFKVWSLKTLLKSKKLFARNWGSQSRSWLYISFNPLKPYDSCKINWRLLVNKHVDSTGKMLLLENYALTEVPTKLRPDLYEPLVLLLSETVALKTFVQHKVIFWPTIYFLTWRSCPTIRMVDFPLLSSKWLQY